MTRRSPGVPARFPFRMRLLLAAFAAIAPFAAFVLLVLLSSCAKPARQRGGRVPVTVAKAEVRTVPLSLTATGTVEAIQNADVGSQVGGVVTRVAFREGQEVRAGQVLIELDQRPFRSSLEQARATLAKDRAQAENAQRDAERSQTLYQQNVLSQAEWDQKRAAATGAAATARADSAAVTMAQLNLHYATIRAPVSGQTGRLMVHVGDLVKAATSEALVTVVQKHPVRVRFTVPVDDVPLVQRYRNSHPSVLVRVPSGDSTAIRGTLVFVDNAVDQQSGTLLLKGELPNRDGALVPGQFVDVQLVLDEQKDQIVVPGAALSRGQEGAFVYVLEADSTVTPRPVVVDRTVDDLVVVRSGIKAGETVITDGQLRLSPGAKALVREAGDGHRAGAARGEGGSGQARGRGKKPGGRP